MAIIKKNELKNMDVTQLKNKLSELRRELIKINTQRSTKTVPENPGRIKVIRRTIARILTSLNNKRREVTKTQKS